MLILKLQTTRLGGSRMNAEEMEQKFRLAHKHYMIYDRAGLYVVISLFLIMIAAIVFSSSVNDNPPIIQLLSICVLLLVLIPLAIFGTKMKKNHSIANSVAEELLEVVESITIVEKPNPRIVVETKEEQTTIVCWAPETETRDLFMSFWNNMLGENMC